IKAFNDVDTGALTISSAAGVGGGGDGIDALNFGAGDLSITATGMVTGGSGDGIRAENTGGNLAISAAGVSGADDGIDARNYGSGALSVTASGDVTGQASYGIFAYNDTNGTDLKISATSVEGGLDGIIALNEGSGALSINATGTVTGQTSYGILAFNGSGGTDLAVSAFDVEGGSGGIAVLNEGTGAVSVTATGTVDGGTKGGISAYNAATGTDLSVTAAGVSGGQDGIYAANFGTGVLAIETTGSVTGVSDYGVFARLGKDGGGLTINVTDVTGGNAAILVDNEGTAPGSVTVSGTVSGGTGAGILHISVDDNDSSQIELTETGSISSASGVAIQDGNGATSVISRGALAGSVQMNAGEDQLALIAGSATGAIKMGSDNDAIQIFGLGVGGGWDDSGFTGVFTNNLGQVLDLDGGGGIDTVELVGVTAASQALGTVSNIEALALSTGTLLQANNADLTSFGIVFVGAGSVLQLEGNSPSDSTTGSIGNQGTIDLLDGETNDTLTIQGNFAGGTGSVIQLDLDTDTNTSDSVIIEGDVTNVEVGSFVVENTQTTIVLNVIGDGQAGQTGADGIRLVEVEGDVSDNAFILDGGSFDLGLLEYDLVISGGTLFLDSTFLAPIYAYENLPGGLQTIGSATVGQLVERTGRRTAAEAGSGLWSRAVGLSLESDGDIDNTSGGSFDQTIGFLQAGAEIELLRRESGTLLVGLMGHWGQSSLDTTDINGDAAGDANIDLFGGGVNVTWYGANGWYFDNVFQYTGYDLDVSGAGRFGTASTDGYGIAVSHEAGYRIDIGETAALVPQAQITYQRVDFDDFTDPDGVRVALEDGDSLIGRLGVAFENSGTIGSALVTGYAEANVLHEFLGDNQVDATAMGQRVALNQDLGGTSAELGFGGTVEVANGVSVFAEIDYTLPFDGGVRGVQALGGIRINLNPPPR
ncbi:MAG: autotransporter outer membrane beta-barrel domain-containing protein, partial [Pseudomonadota bacterium]